MNQNQMAVMQQAQEESRRNMEMLAKTLSEARQDPARREEAAELAQSLKKAKEDYSQLSAGLGETETLSEVESVHEKLRSQYAQAQQAGNVVQGGLEQLSETGAKGLDALVSALTEAQVKSAELQAKTQSETMAKIFRKARK